VGCVVATEQTVQLDLRRPISTTTSSLRQNSRAGDSWRLLGMVGDATLSRACQTVADQVGRLVAGRALAKP
jgi:hypothetical protein